MSLIRRFSGTIQVTSNRMRTRWSLAILSTHPIQYHSAWFRALSAHPELNLHVYYCRKASPSEQGRAGFGVEFDWDVPLLDGYPFTFLSYAGNGRNHSAAKLERLEIKNAVRRHDAVLVNGWHYR